MKSIDIADATLTAGQMVLWKGALTNEMLLPILPRIDKAGFKSIELIDPFVFQTCLGILGEDPWERIRLAAKRLSNTPASAWIAGPYLFGGSPGSRDLAATTLRRLAFSGITALGVYEPRNDVRELVHLLEDARNCDLELAGGIVYLLGDAYPNEYFAEKARELVKMGCTTITLLDLAGVLHPERVRELIPVLRGAVNVLLELRTHCRSARAEITCLAALELGVGSLHAVAEPLSGGDSLPASDFFVEHLHRQGYRLNLDRDAVAAIRDYFEGVADYWQLPRATPHLYDPGADRRQIPVELEAQLQAAELGDDTDDRPAPIPVPLRSRSERATIDRGGWSIVAESPLQQLIAELERRPWVQKVRVRKGTLVFETGSGEW